MAAKAKRTDSLGPATRTEVLHLFPQRRPPSMSRGSSIAAGVTRASRGKRHPCVGLSWNHLDNLPPRSWVMVGCLAATGPQHDLVGGHRGLGIVALQVTGRSHD
jgi:hypothetical protein